MRRLLVPSRPKMRRLFPPADPALICTDPATICVELILICAAPALMCCGRPARAPICTAPSRFHWQMATVDGRRRRLAVDGQQRVEIATTPAVATLAGGGSSRRRWLLSSPAAPEPCQISQGPDCF
jgi:hypothetical protein